MEGAWCIFIAVIIANCSADFQRSNLFAAVVSPSPVKAASSAVTPGSSEQPPAAKQLQSIASFSADALALHPTSWLDPCSQHVLSTTTHGTVTVLQKMSALDEEQFTIIMLELFPKLRDPLYLVILCSTGTRKYSFYISELEIDDKSVPNDWLTREIVNMLNQGLHNQTYYLQHKALLSIIVSTTVFEPVNNNILRRRQAMEAASGSSGSGGMSGSGDGSGDDGSDFVCRSSDESICRFDPSKLDHLEITLQAMACGNNDIETECGIEEILTGQIISGSTVCVAVQDSGQSCSAIVYTVKDSTASTELTNMLFSILSSNKALLQNYGFEDVAVVPPPSIPTADDSFEFEEWHIVLISAGVLSLGLCVILLTMTFYFRRQKRGNKPRQRVFNTSYFGEENFELHPIAPQISKKISKIVLKPTSPVLTSLLTVDKLKEMLKNPQSIEDEYSQLPPSSDTMEDVPVGAEYKNRYRNVLPNPRTRVVLFLQPGVPNSDYVNANYIRGPKLASKYYIAAQGPLAETVDDFWRMVWEQRCSTIVMLTKCIENDISKCYQYWPDERINRTVVYGELLVTVAQRETREGYWMTTFQLQHKDKAVTREVVHFWLTSWPDHGVPNSASLIISFIQEIRSYVKEIPGPVLVHCSAGIGRSGVYIAADIGMQQLENYGFVDVLKIVSLLRQDRGGMVQTRDQYRFVYQLLCEYSNYLTRISSSQIQYSQDYPDDTSEMSDDDELDSGSQASLL